MSYRFGPTARHEFLEAGSRYLSGGGPQVAGRFARAVKKALALLVIMPELGSPSYPNVRTWPLRRFPYTLVYRMSGVVLVVVAVAHQGRALGYWLGRS